MIIFISEVYHLRLPQIPTRFEYDNPLIYNSAMSNESAEQEPRSLEISFGDVFERTFGGRTKTFVIVDLGESDWFYATPTVSLKSGKRGLFGVRGGSFLPEYIDKKTGDRWSLDEILTAYNNWAREAWGGKMSTDMVNILTERSRRPSRVLNF